MNPLEGTYNNCITFSVSACTLYGKLDFIFETRCTPCKEETSLFQNLAYSQRIKLKSKLHPKQFLLWYNIIYSIALYIICVAYDSVWAYRHYLEAALSTTFLFILPTFCKDLFLFTLVAYWKHAGDFPDSTSSLTQHHKNTFGFGDIFVFASSMYALCKWIQYLICGFVFSLIILVCKYRFLEKTITNKTFYCVGVNDREFWKIKWGHFCGCIMKLIMWTMTVKDSSSYNSVTFIEPRHVESFYRFEFEAL